VCLIVFVEEIRGGRRRAAIDMGLEFKPYFAWEDEERECHVGKEKQMVESDEVAESVSGEGGSGEGEEAGVAPAVAVAGVGLVFVHADGTPAVPGAPVGAGRELALAPALAAVNGEGREYAVLVASEEDNVNEYKSFFSIVLDHPQFLGQGETKESALRQASRLLHYALGSMVLKNETIPAPSAGAELEVRRPLQCIGSEFRVDCCRRIGEM
jgi:predicted RNase H-like HicB family nuclease